ncbi:MAG: galactokinase [Gemmatimonadota bacterium]|nr:galactokinase [Gemmatimonadota bacterium]
MRRAAAERKQLLLDRATATLRSMGPTASLPGRALWVPGRIEFLGKHTDYAGGRSLLCAAERGIALVWRPRLDGHVRVADAVRSEQAESTYALTAETEPGHWSNYPFTVMRRIRRNFSDPLVGADIAFASDLPPAAGMSSSSALIVGMFLALADVSGLAEREEYRTDLLDRADLAGYLGTVENGQPFRGMTGDSGVGTFGGSEDQTAILCSRPGMLVQYAFAPVRFERAVPLPHDHLLVIASSGVAAEKSGAARELYNGASLAVQRMLDLWSANTGQRAATLGVLLESAPHAAADLAAMLRSEAETSRGAGGLPARLEQFITESGELVPSAADALEAGDLRQLGVIVDRSQAAAEALLGNQLPETSYLARSARELGAVAASAFGAGYGGSVWALVVSDGREEFISRWERGYAHRFPERAQGAEMFTTAAGPPSMRL